MKKKNKPNNRTSKCLQMILAILLLITSTIIQPMNVYAAGQTLPSGLERVQLEEKIDEFVMGII